MCMLPCFNFSLYNKSLKLFVLISPLLFLKAPILLLFSETVLPCQDCLFRFRMQSSPSESVLLYQTSFQVWASMEVFLSRSVVRCTAHSPSGKVKVTAWETGLQRLYFQVLAITVLWKEFEILTYKVLFFFFFFIYTMRWVPLACLKRLGN